MSVSLAPARGRIDFKQTEFETRTKFFNMYDSLDRLQVFDPVEIVGYPSHCMDLVKMDGEGDWRTAVDDDELLLVVRGAVTVDFRDEERQVAKATAVDGEILLLPRALSYRIRSGGEAPALCLHFRTRASVERG